MTARTLLVGGVVAGPFYLGVALLQALTRDGFDITRHAVSLLSLGAMGWVQVANFIATGLLVLACAVGLRRVMRGAVGGSGAGGASGARGAGGGSGGSRGLGGTWGPLFLGVYGVALVASGLFPADAGFGFPPGTPDGPPAAMTTAGTLHFTVGGIGFMALIGACMVLARRYSVEGARGMALFSAVTGFAFLAAFMGIASGPPRPATVLGLWLGLTLTWVWLAMVAWRARSASVAVGEGAADEGAAGNGAPPAIARNP